MKIIKKIKPDLLRASSCALGMFDGVHLGHQKVIQESIVFAKKQNLNSAVITFANHPQTITTKTPAKLLTSLENRLHLFEKLGLDATLVIPFDESFCKIKAEDFIKDILLSALNVRHISVGYDYRFGHNKGGDKNLLDQYGKLHGYSLTVHEPYKLHGHIVSSSVIRKLIYDGDFDLANELLGYQYSIKGQVIHGFGRGKNLGFPTANIAKDPNKVFPAQGVYLGYTSFNKLCYKALINIGKRPTFNDISEELMEVHILNFDGDLYGLELEITFAQKIRDEQKFNSVEDLMSQIQQDYILAQSL